MSTDKPLEDRIEAYLSARDICGESNKGDDLLRQAHAKLFWFHDLLARSLKGPEFLSLAEQRALDALKADAPTGTTDGGSG